MIPVSYRLITVIAAAAFSLVEPATGAETAPPVPLADTGHLPQEMLPEQQPGPGALPFAGDERAANQCKGMTLLSRGVVAEAGTRHLELVVGNTGERWLDPALSVDLFMKGELVAQFRRTVHRIAPGHALRHRIDLTELPPGRYHALAIVQNRDGDISGTREELEIE